MPELENSFFQFNSWSFTKHRIWNQCRRQYFYKYIAQHLKPPAPVDVNKIIMLKEYNSRFVLQGKLIHNILNEQIKGCSNTIPMDPAGSLSFYSRQIAQNKMMASEMFTEYRHGEPVSDTFFTTIDDSGKACLNMFFQNIWPNYENQECLKHEEFDYFRTGNVKVTVKVDFVSKMQNGTIVLSDWKTGTDNDENETELQMATYVLWAMQYYDKSLDEIQSESVFLKNGKTKPYLFFEEQLREVQNTIKMEYEAMNTSYEYNDYPTMPNPQGCLSCQFARICSDSGIGK